MFRPFWPPIDEPPCVSFDVATRLKERGYPAEFARLGYAPDEDGIARAAPFAAGMLPAPSAGELLRYYLEVSDSIDHLVVYARRSDYLASGCGVSRVAPTIDDAVAEVILHALGDRKCSRV